MHRHISRLPNFKVILRLLAISWPRYHVARSFQYGTRRAWGTGMVLPRLGDIDGHVMGMYLRGARIHW